MATGLLRSRHSDRNSLAAGMELRQSEFHRRYQALTTGKKFELIDGEVFMAAAERRPHGKTKYTLAVVLSLYERATPGIEVLDNVTLLLGENDEPQPDLLVRVLESHGGISRIDDEGYISGPVELVIEISDSTLHYDRGRKRLAYAAHGIQEYWVVSLPDQKIHAESLVSQRPIAPNRQGIIGSQVFPGLKVDVAALFGFNHEQLVPIARSGLKTAAHWRGLSPDLGDWRELVAAVHVAKTISS